MSNISAIRNMVKDSARINVGNIPVYVCKIMFGAWLFEVPPQWTGSLLQTLQCNWLEIVRGCLQFQHDNILFWGSSNYLTCHFQVSTIIII